MRRNEKIERVCRIVMIVGAVIAALGLTGLWILSANQVALYYTGFGIAASTTFLVNASWVMVYVILAGGFVSLFGWAITL